MASILRQTWTLTRKNLLIVLQRHAFATVVRAFVLPILIMAFLSFAKNLFVPPAIFGISPAHPVRSLADGLAVADGTGRDTVVFVHSGFTGGAIERVIGELADVVRGVPGKTVVVAESDRNLAGICRASLRGVSPCYGAVVFRASPDEGAGGRWNYTIRVDSALGVGRINVKKDTNDAQVYMLPLQHAVDAAISRDTPGMTPLPEAVDEYPYTRLTQAERADQIRTLYQGAIMNFLGVTFIAGMIGIAYHLTGFMATERETGMSTLIEAMMATSGGWQGQVARLLSYHLSFSLIYLPGWVIGSLILWSGVFRHTSAALVLIYHLLAGLALASMSIFGGAFFKKSQLSGVSTTILFILLAIIAQVISFPKTGTVAVLSLLFAPCNYTFFISYVARWEQQEWPTDLTKTAPTSPWNLPGIVLWIFLILQIVLYPILGALVERSLHGTTTDTRTIGGGSGGDDDETAAAKLEGFTKIYKPGPFRRLFSFVSRVRDPVVAVDGLTLTARRGQILALLGANGSGKSTTLDAIAGISKLTSGNITIGSGGLGIAPQKNVLWDEVTVEEHIRIFNRLKSPPGTARANRDETRALIASIDLAQKVKAQAKTLSGGQKRKLQLGMMLTGGSAVCCVDEVSSGLDPLSRRKIWDILLAERGRRTMIMTTHFLDEADLLADHIAILSKGMLRAEGSSVELKDRLGGGYRIHVHHHGGHQQYEQHTLPDVAGVTKKTSFEEVVYITTSSSLAATVIKELEAAGITDYRFSGPTIEDVFLQLAEEVRLEDGALMDEGSTAVAGAESRTETEKHESSLENITGTGGGGGLELLSGRRIGYLRQTWVLFLKRCTILKGNWFPTVAAFLIPVVAAGLVTLFVRNQAPLGCNPADQSTERTAVDIFTDFDIYMVGGPADRLSESTLARLFLPIYQNSLGGGTGGSSSSSSASKAAAILNSTRFVTSLDEFNTYIVENRKNVTPAGIWLGDATSRPTLAYKGSGLEMVDAWFGQWVMNMVLTNTTIASNFINFDLPLSPDAGKSLQFIVYVCLALSAYPAFFALYPNLERRRLVRGLEYSNGVRPLPLWLAYTAFDFIVVLTSSAIAAALFAGLAHLWYHVAYLFLIFILYGLASVLLAYNISLFANTQLSAYAFAAAGQVVFFLIYLIAYMSTITYAPVNKIDDYLLLVHFLVSAFAPICSAARALFLALNLFSTACDGNNLSTSPGGLLQYGGPILYLIVQSVVLFLTLIWWDAGNVGAGFKKLLFWRKGGPDARVDRDDPVVSDEEVANELVRVKSSATTGAGGSKKGGSGETVAKTTDGLRVVNLTKSFGSNTAVDNVTFGIQRGEVFALLGPNGAGKSTTISVIRGDLRPSGRGGSGGDVFVEDVSVTRHLAAARSHLGVCPQFDAIDQMTVREHLRFYARVRGISGRADLEHNVSAVLRAVGLRAFADRQAHALSGGNKRKLSLGIALMGNPTVLLLDEPSSGLDAAAKRIMWRTLAATVPGRSILLTTHSMEEADALAGRAGILAKRMLAMGTTDNLRNRFGDTLHVHLVCRNAPRTTGEDIQRVRDWVVGMFGGQEEAAVVEEKSYHGQMKFSVSAAAIVGAVFGSVDENYGKKGAPVPPDQDDRIKQQPEATRSAASAIGKLVVLLEEKRDELGIEHYSVSPTTLDQVFLTVVGRHNVREEGYEEQKPAKRKWFRFGKKTSA
ncbi:P-loop containing nucleoside triphosphate hydrolase protein [Apodospora peruviana]|uniref:P-loop containing nucleoside triphosphate hydrolase protein n=1 Tax=Apodospora peruviana TaxID=516989 RepID=A0AAE0I065_9PEZI|nr:P-loop containing nucleoside triphosphate hydrolase protein [Apodospora peruviana]